MCLVAFLCFVLPLFIVKSCKSNNHMSFLLSARPTPRVAALTKPSGGWYCIEPWIHRSDPWLPYGFAGFALVAFILPLFIFSSCQEQPQVSKKQIRPGLASSAEACSASCQGGERWRHRHMAVEANDCGVAAPGMSIARGPSPRGTRKAESGKQPGEGAWSVGREGARLEKEG